MNDVWIKVTSCATGKRQAINLRHVVSVAENDSGSVRNGHRATINFSDGKSLVVYESFDEIGAMVR